VELEAIQPRKGGIKIISRYFVTDQLNDDELDREGIAKDIHDMMPHIPMSPKYLKSCQDFLDKLPEILDMGVSEGWPTISRPHFQSTVEFEASYKIGCRLCVLLVQCILTATKTLEMFHKVERRLKCLGEEHTIFMSVDCEDGDLLMFLSWPGRPFSRERSMATLYIVPVGSSPRKC
jgi:hypothetical protein